MLGYLWHDQRQTQTPEGAIRYLLPGGKLGTSDLTGYLRMLGGVAGWFGIPPLIGRFCGRIGARGILADVQRMWAQSLWRYLGVQMDIRGLEHLHPNERYIIVPLHEGFADVPALLHIPLRLRFVVRDELLGWWLWLGPYLRDTAQISICPEEGINGYRTLRRAAQAVFAAGESLVIFPQGSILGIEIDCWPGAFALARSLGYPLLPIVLTGTHRIWEYPFTPRLRFGQPVSMWIVPPLSAHECRAHSVNDLRMMVQTQLKRIALSGDVVPPRRFLPARDGYWHGYAYRIDPNFPDLAAEVAAQRARVRFIPS